MTIKLIPRTLLAAALLLCGLSSVAAFPIPSQKSSGRFNSKLLASGDDEGRATEPSNLLEDIKGMLSNFDDVVDDFVMKRMGAGEQWYGKRKYNPSGRVEGDYNGMGRSSYYAIEIARVQKEMMEERKQRRLEEEEASRENE